MKARPILEPTSWLFQANIHVTSDPVPRGAAGVWNTCQHGSFFFLSWHRMYLYYFERILHAASGVSNFALPYWSYGVPSQRSLPEPFRLPPELANPLFVAQRRSSINAGQPVPPGATSDAQAMATMGFASPAGSGLGFGGQAVPSPVHFSGTHGRIESQPHDVIHVAVGGGGWMSDPRLAARDPVFWVHHCNIDRLWNRWLAVGGGRKNPTADAAWMGTKFSFYNERGQRVSITGADVLDSVGQLGYRYDDDPSPVAEGGTTETASTSLVPRPTRVIAARAGTESAIILDTREVTIALSAVAGSFLENAVESSRSGGTPVVISFDQIAYRRPVGHYFEVYLNLPAGAEADPFGPYFARNLSFFGLGHMEESGSATGGRIELPVTDVLDNQRQRGLWSGDRVQIKLVPLGVEPGTTEAGDGGQQISIGDVRLLGP